jgi:hypothetical protein
VLALGAEALAPAAAAAAVAVAAYYAGSDKHFATVDAENQEQLRRARESARTPIGFGAPQDGYDDFGNPVSAPGGGPRRSNGMVFKGDVFLDGKKVGDIVAKRLGEALSGPMLGTTGFDPSMHPAYQGLNP